MPHSTTGADDTTAYLHIETPTELEIELRHWFTIWGEEFSILISWATKLVKRTR